MCDVWVAICQVNLLSNEYMMMMMSVK